MNSLRASEKLISGNENCYKEAPLYKACECVNWVQTPSHSDFFKCLIHYALIEDFSNALLLHLYGN